MNTNGQKPTIKIIPLGGLHEIGKNTCIFEYDDEILLLDAGLAFPTDEMHGINIVLPDITYLLENRHKIKGMIVTHGHEDHIGGIAYHLKQFDIPIIYGPRLAMVLLRDKLEEAGVLERTNIKTVSPRDTVKIGQHFTVEFIRNTHSIADSFTVAITTPLGVIIHSGDFKMDHTPVDGEKFDLQRLAEYGEKGVLCLLSDSTNAEIPGYTPSESSVIPNLDRIFSQAEGRIMVTTFASSVHRVNIVLQLALKHKRKVAVVGRSMLNVIAHCRNLGYIKCPDDLFEPLRAVRGLPDEKILILTTGSQGEPLAAMTRISKGEHPQIKIRKGDTVVFSANPIPGNTIAVVNTIDRLMMQGANVVYGRNQGIHVSGHGAQEDHKLMLALTKPKFFLPVHGEHRMLVQHAKTAQSLGVPPENMVIIDNGDMVELAQDHINVSGRVPSGIELVDHAGIVHDVVMKERQQLAEDGIITVATAIDEGGKWLVPPEVHLRGVVTGVEHSLLNKMILRTIDKTLSDCWDKFNHDIGIDWTGLRIELDQSLQRLMKRELRSRPLLVFLMQSPEQTIEFAPVQTSQTIIKPSRAKVKIKPSLEIASNGEEAPQAIAQSYNEEAPQGIIKPAMDTPARRRRRRSAASVAS
jgi:ribonuclease J